MRFRALAIVAVAAAATGCVGDASSAGDPVRLRILSYNMHHGRGADERIDLERIAAVIRSCRPDIVALQEVDRRTQRSGEVDQPAELARLTGLRAVFARNIGFQGGDYGNAVLSRLPVLSHRNCHLPSFHRGEQRGALAVDIEVTPDFVVTFVATHLDYRPGSEERVASAAAIETFLAPLDGTPAVLAGDLNDTPGSPTLAAFETGWTPATSETELLTYPAREPRKQIDFVLFRPRDRWRVIDVRVLEEPTASDHRPLLVVLESVTGH